MSWDVATARRFSNLLAGTGTVCVGAWIPAPLATGGSSSAVSSIRAGSGSGAGGGGSGAAAVPGVAGAAAAGAGCPAARVAGSGGGKTTVGDGSADAATTGCEAGGAGGSGWLLDSRYADTWSQVPAP